MQMFIECEANRSEMGQKKGIGLKLFADTCGAVCEKNGTTKKRLDMLHEWCCERSVPGTIQGAIMRAFLLSNSRGSSGHSRLEFQFTLTISLRRLTITFTNPSKMNNLLILKR